MKSASTESLEACGVDTGTPSTSEDSSPSIVKPTPLFRKILNRRKHKSGSATSPLTYSPLLPSCHNTPEGRQRRCTTGSTPAVQLEFPFSHLSKYLFSHFFNCYFFIILFVINFFDFLVSNSRDSSPLVNPKKSEIAEENNNY